MKTLAVAFLGAALCLFAAEVAVAQDGAASAASPEATATGTAGPGNAGGEKGAPDRQLADYLAGLPKGRSLLVRGPELLRGLPFFSANAIPALSGEYLAGQVRIPFWYTRESLVFSAPWKDGGAGAATGTVSAAPHVWILREEARYVVAWKHARYTLMMAFPTESLSRGPFPAAFLLRFAFFFENAATDAELSFPASVDY